MERLTTGTAPILRRCVAVAGRNVHLRTAGEGPTVVLMHDSPRSSRRLVPLAAALADRFHVVALDTPGFGGSDALPFPTPRIEDLADSVCATLDALGLDRPLVYGTHTSSKIAVELALRHRERVAGLVLDGISVQSEPQRRRFLEGDYLKGHPASLDGAHLASIWAKMLDQFRFFPYNERVLRSRLSWPMPAPEIIDEHLLDLLEAGADFGRTYSAAFRYDAASRLPLLNTPTSIVCRLDDVLIGELSRLPQLPSCVDVAKLPAESAAWLDAVVERLARYVALASTGRAEPTDVDVAPPRRRFLGPAGQQLHVHVLGAASAPAVCILPDLPGTASGSLAVARSLAARYRVIVPDLPGCGDSDPMIARPNVDDIADRILAGLRELDSSPLSVVASTWSSPIAASMAARPSSPVTQLILDGVLRLDDRQRALVDTSWPDLAAERAGSHLQRAWHFLRDQTLSWPWCETAPVGIRAVAPDLDAAQLQSQLVGLLKQRQSAMALFRELAARAGEPLPALRAKPVTVLVVEDDPAYAGVDTLVRDLPQKRAMRRPASRAAALHTFAEAIQFRGSA